MPEDLVTFLGKNGIGLKVEDLYRRVMVACNDEETFLSIKRVGPPKLLYQRITASSFEIGLCIAKAFPRVIVIEESMHGKLDVVRYVENFITRKACKIYMLVEEHSVGEKLENEALYDLVLSKPIDEELVAKHLKAAVNGR